MSARRVSVILVGFRNDIAKARTIQFLRGQGKAPDSPDLPWLLYEDVEQIAGEKIKAELEALGAQVVVNEMGARLVAASAEPAWRESTARQANPVFGRAVALIVVAALGVGLLMLAGLGNRTKHAKPEAPLRKLVAPIPVVASQPLDIDHQNPHEVVDLNSQAVLLANRKDYAAAADKLRRARKLAPAQTQITANLQMVLLSWAGLELEEKRPDLALEHLKEGDACGDNSEVVLMLAVAAQRADQEDLAIATLERGLKLAPKNTGMLLMLAEYRIQQRDRTAALDLLQQARDSGLHDRQLDQRIAALAREVDAEWDFVERESAHFAISFAGDEDPSNVRYVLDALEDAYRFVGAKFHTYPNDKTAIVLYTQENFHSVTQTPDWAGGAFDGRIKLPVGGLTTADDNELTRVLRHEYTHRIISTLSGNRAPVWLQEGLAVWAEEERDGDHEAAMHQALGDQRPTTLTGLTGSFAQLPAGAAQTAYAESYFAARALIDRFGSASIPEFLQALQTRSLDDAFAAVFREKFSDFDDRFQREYIG